MQPLRPGLVAHAKFQHPLHHRHAARLHVADDDAIGSLVQLFRAVALGNRDAGLLQLYAHRRARCGIRPGNPVTAFLRDARESGHETAGDTEDMDVHPVRGDQRRKIHSRSEDSSGANR